MAFSAAAAAKPNINSNNKESKGMGLLLVFFHGGVQKVQNKITNSSIDDNQNITTTTARRFIKRTTSSTLLSTKAQSTISICVLLVFITLLLFTLSTFEPSPTIKNPRRVLSQKAQLSPSYWFSPLWDYNKPLNVKQQSNLSPSSYALQKMGTLYRRGTKAMNDLVVTHVVEDVSEDEVRLFLRTLHRSGLTSKADIVFLFGSVSVSSRLVSVIHEENDSFLKLIRHYKESNNKGSRVSVFSFDSTQFWKSGKKDVGETIWGRKGRGNSSSSSNNSSESTRLTYGSVVGFDVNELDPENSLGGFLDHVPMSFRRWACYPMLLGRIRRNFKHIMLLDAKSLMLLGDPLGRIRSRRPESVYLLTKESSPGKHKKNSDKTQSHSQVNSAILMGGARGIRRLADAMLTEIVRATMQHKKKKNSITESEILSQLVGNGYVLKNIDLITSTETIQEASSLMGSSSNLGAADYSVVHRSNSNHDLNSIIMKLICLCETNSHVYRDC